MRADSPAEQAEENGDEHRAHTRQQAATAHVFQAGNGSHKFDVCFRAMSWFVSIPLQTSGMNETLDSKADPGSLSYRNSGLLSCYLTPLSYR